MPQHLFGGTHHAALPEGLNDASPSCARLASSRHFSKEQEAGGSLHREDLHFPAFRQELRELGPRLHIVVLTRQIARHNARQTTWHITGRMLSLA